MGDWDCMAESRDPGWPGRSQFNMGQSFLDRMSDSARKRYMESMMAGIMELGMDGQNSDIEIIVEGQSFPCHKILLAAGACSYSTINPSLSHQNNMCIRYTCTVLTGACSYSTINPSLSHQNNMCILYTCSILAPACSYSTIIPSLLPQNIKYVYCIPH